MQSRCFCLGQLPVSCVYQPMYGANYMLYTSLLGCIKRAQQKMGMYVRVLNGLVMSAATVKAASLSILQIESCHDGIYGNGCLVPLYFVQCERPFVMVVTVHCEATRMKYFQRTVPSDVRGCCGDKVNAGSSLNWRMLESEPTWSCSEVWHEVYWC